MAGKTTPRRNASLTETGIGLKSANVEPVFNRMESGLAIGHLEIGPLFSQNQAALLQNQAAFLARASETDARLAEMDRINSERFARIEALLLEHNRILQALPDAIREKIDFKTTGP